MSRTTYGIASYGIAAMVILLCSTAIAPVALADSFAPSLTINTTQSDGITNAEVFGALRLSFFLSILVLLPSILMSVTCFTRIAIVLSLTRQALGTAQTPPNQILVGLALFMTVAIMSPVFSRIYTESLLPYSEDKIAHGEAFEKAFVPLREFMLKHTRQDDLELFTEVVKQTPPESPEDLGPAVVIPAFIISELNAAFQISFLIFLPFLILDMIISSVLTSMSMITLPPTVISLPIKMMLFVVIDGWNLIIGNLIKSYS